MNANDTAGFEHKRLKYIVSLRRSRADGTGDDRPFLGLEHVQSWTGGLTSGNGGPDAEQAPGSGESLSGTFEMGDVLFGKLRPYLAKAWLADSPGRCTTEFLVLTPIGVEGRFLRYVLLWNSFIDSVDASTFGSKMPRADWDFIGNLPVPLPDRGLQQAIADYLDRETARLDALIAAKERLLVLLAEKRQALITRAVTRGLDPNVPLRDSGIPWLGMIPAHWKVCRLRFLVTSIEQGWSPEAENREVEIDEWGILKLNAVSKGRFDQTAAKALPARETPRPDLEVRSGDFLVTRANTPSLVGDVCFVEDARPRLMLCDLIYRLALRRETIDGHFLNYYLGTAFGRAQIESDARGSSGSMVKISQEHIKDWWIPHPPVPEQKAIVTDLANRLEPHGRLVSTAERTIALLKERRAALIAAAVTGQIPIPSEAVA